MEDWIQDNKFLTGWIVVTVAGCVALVMLLLKARGRYEAAYEDFGTARDQVLGLESKPLYPSEENVARKTEAVEVYRESVDALHRELAGLQRPLRNVEQTAFKAKLNARIKNLAIEARKTGVELPEKFSFGMFRYVTELPRIDMCPLLDYQLDSISALCAALVSRGVSSIDSIKRANLPGEDQSSRSDEKDEQAEEVISVVQRFPVELVFTTKPEALREFLNVVSNPVPGAPFHVVRLVRVANQKQRGPLRGARAIGGQAFIEEEEIVAGEETREAVSANDEAEPVDGFADPGSLEPSASEFVFDEILPEADVETEPVVDAEFVLGQEKIEVYMKIELLRFAPPVVERASAEAADGA